MANHGTGTGLAFRIAEFFAANPDEELTFRDLQTKFDVTMNNVHFAVRQLVEYGNLESVHVVRLRVKGIARTGEML